MDRATEITARPEVLGSLAVVGLATVLGLWGRKIWHQSNDKDCERWFGFWPQLPLTPEQVSKMEEVVSRWSEQFHTLARTKVDLEKANRTLEAGLLNHDVEYAELNLCIALANAKRTVRRYMVDSAATITRLERLA